MAEEATREEFEMKRISAAKDLGKVCVSANAHEVERAVKKFGEIIGVEIPEKKTDDQSKNTKETAQGV